MTRVSPISILNHSIEAVTVLVPLDSFSLGEGAHSEPPASLVDATYDRLGSLEDLVDHATGVDFGVRLPLRGLLDHLELKIAARAGVFRSRI